MMGHHCLGGRGAPCTSWLPFCNGREGRQGCRRQGEAVPWRSL